MAPKIVDEKIVSIVCKLIIICHQIKIGIRQNVRNVIAYNKLLYNVINKSTSTSVVKLMESRRLIQRSQSVSADRQKERIILVILQPDIENCSNENLA